MKDDGDVDEHGNVMPCIKRWHRGYWMIDINYDKGEVQFKNCLITWNQDVLKAMRLEFEGIKDRSTCYKLNTDMTRQDKERLIGDIERDLLGDGTEKAGEETEVGDSGPDDEL
ncbi:MAG: hypothetical protein IH899_19465 [Planctomycetes bacterium]|nr:hypothetical protein [Planctomycetota bacterium]